LKGDSQKKLTTGVEEEEVPYREEKGRGSPYGRGGNSSQQITQFAERKTGPRDSRKKIATGTSKKHSKRKRAWE